MSASGQGSTASDGRLRNAVSWWCPALLASRETSPQDGQTDFRHTGGRELVERDLQGILVAVRADHSRHLVAAPVTPQRVPLTPRRLIDAWLGIDKQHLR